MKKDKLKNLRYIALGRQSDDSDGASATSAQFDFIDKKCASHAMRFVEKIALEGVTGSLPGRREDLQGLLERKRKFNDFDVIAVQLPDRLTRGGGKHGMWFEHECERNGIRIFFAGDDTPEGPYSSLVKVAKYESAHSSSVTTGQRSAQGQEYAKKLGFFRTSGQTPMGCYRLYFDQSDTPKFIIRNLMDGRQEQIDPKSGQVIGTFGTVGNKSRNRFEKQRNEYSLLMPGDRQPMQTGRVIFYLRYKKGWRGVRITEFLNSNGRLSPKGGKWSQRQVESIYENEAYTGFTYNNQTYSGRFVRGDKRNGYIDLEREECDLAVAKYFKPVFRPFDDWQKIDQPYMKDFLPQDVRDLAITAQKEMWKKRLDPKRVKREFNAHPASTYLFSKTLTAIQDGETLKGTLTGPVTKKVAYYRHPRGKRGRQKGSIFNNLIPAKPLHEELFRILGEVLLDTPNLRSMLVDIVTEQREQTAQARSNKDELEAKRAELDERIRITISTQSGVALSRRQADLTQWNNELNEIEGILKARNVSQKVDQKPAEEVADEAILRLRSLASQISILPADPLRRLVNHLVRSATVDMETKEVKFEIAAPVWSLIPPMKGSTDLCPPTSQRSQDGGWTQRVLAVLKCDNDHLAGSNKPVCYRCRRVAA